MVCGSGSAGVFGGVVVIGGVRASRRNALAESGLRFTLTVRGGLPAEAGSRPGGRVPFLCRQERNQRSGPRFNAARFAHGPLRCSKHRVAAELALAALGAQTVLATAMLRMSEPDASALLGVSEGEGNASTFCRRSILGGRKRGGAAPTAVAALFHLSDEHHPSVAPRMVLTFGSRRERRVAERDRAEGRGLFELRAQRGRVPQAPGRASNAGESGAQCLTANAGSPFLGYFFWRSKRSNPPAGCGNPANALSHSGNANRQPQSSILKSSVGLGNALQHRRVQSATRAAWGVDPAPIREYRIQNPEARTASPFTTIPLRENRS